VNCDVPRVFQLRLTISNNQISDQKTLPTTASTELGFPSSIVLGLPGSRSGAVEVVVEAIDNKLQNVGTGRVTGTIAQGGRTDLEVQISAVVTSSPIGGSPNGIDGGVASDAGADGKSDAAAGSGVPFSQIAAGSVSTCAIRSDTSLWCWGNNTYGQLNLSGTTDRPTPGKATGLSWSTIACGQSHACGIRDGSLSCWGYNFSGQLGAATSAVLNQQVEVPDGPWQGIAAGSYHSCGIKADATLWCWGDNANGQLGTGNTMKSTEPFQVPGAGWSQISSGYLHSCAVKQEGTLWCWGLNADFQVDPSSVLPMSPVQVTGSAWTQVATGLYHTCALKQNGTLWCWGGNYSGQLGNSAVAVERNSKTGIAVQVQGTWVTVSAGQSHTCGIMTDHTLWCWGDDSQGQLGDGHETPQSAPVPIGTTGQLWSMVTAGLSHTCALASDGTLWCWGSNSNGQLGIGSSAWRQAPTRVSQ
jgi:alpha-tubulin suppressor-like RCC1 family protein